MTQPLVEPRVTAYLHGGPRDGETLQLPWALTRVQLIRWEDNMMVEDLYHLVGPWRGQDTAHYRYAEPERVVVRRRWWQRFKAA
jgi:hypothetical protein